MPDSARAGLVLGLGMAAVACYPIGVALLCGFGFLHLLIPGGLALTAELFARQMDPEYSEAPRLARLALRVGRPLARLSLALVLLSPLWGFALGEAAWGRRTQGWARAVAHARAVLTAEQATFKKTGGYVTLECLAEGKRCPGGAQLASRPDLLEPVPQGYRFSFQGVPQQGADGRLRDFAYFGVPLVPSSTCPLHATGDKFVCADSTGLVCHMPEPGAAAPADGRCPERCVDVAGARPSPRPSQWPKR